MIDPLHDVGADAQDGPQVSRIAALQRHQDDVDALHQEAEEQLQHRPLDQPGRAQAHDVRDQLGRGLGRAQRLRAAVRPAEQRHPLRRPR